MADTYVYLIRNESNACLFVRNLETVETNQHDVYLGPGAEARYYDDNRPGIPMAKSASEFERHRLVIKKESVSYSIYELDGRVRFTTGGWSKDGSLLPGYSGPGAMALVIDREGNLKGEFHSYVGNRPLGSVNWAPLSIALYGVDARNNVIEKSWTAVKGWGPWSSIGAPDAVTLKGPVTAATWSPTIYGVAALGTNGRVYESRWVSLVRTDWMDLGCPKDIPLVSLAGVSWMPTKYGLYAVGVDGRMYQMWFNVDKFQGWDDLGRPEKATLVGPITAVCMRTGTYAMYALGSDGNVYQKYWSAGHWSAWESIGRPAVNLVSLASVCWDYSGIGRYAIYAVGSDGAVYEKYWFGWWRNWCRSAPPSGGFAGPVTAVCWAPEAYAVYASGKDGRLYEMAWPTHWGRWVEIPGN